MQAKETTLQKLIEGQKQFQAGMPLEAMGAWPYASRAREDLPGQRMPRSVTSYPHPTSAAATAVMRANPRTNTKPELRVRSALHALGYRFRKHLVVEAAGLQVRPTSCSHAAG